MTLPSILRPALLQGFTKLRPIRSSAPLDLALQVTGRPDQELMANAARRPGPLFGKGAGS